MTYRVVVVLTGIGVRTVVSSMRGFGVDAVVVVVVVLLAASLPDSLDDERSMTGLVTIQSWRSNGGSVLRDSQYHHLGVWCTRKTYLNLEGNSLPAQRCILAFGESSPGRPWNLSN